MALTVTPGSTPPVLSDTRPVSPEFACAHTVVAPPAMTTMAMSVTAHHLGEILSIP